MSELKSMNGLPVQPIIMDGDVARYRANKIVKDIFGAASAGVKLDMNMIGQRLKQSPNLYSQAEQMQFAMLIGYSVGGANDLSYFSDDVRLAANEKVNALRPGEAKAEEAPKPSGDSEASEDKGAVSLTEAMQEIEKQD